MQNLDQKNLIIAIVLSIAIVLGFEFFYNLPRLEQQKAQKAQEIAKQATSEAMTTSPAAPGMAPAAPGAAAPSASGSTPPTAPGMTPAPTPAAIATPPALQPRVKIDAPSVSGSIRIAGARLDDLQLTKHRETTEPGSPPVTLLAAQGTANPYFAEFGWVAATQGVTVPNADTVWTPDRQTLTVDQPVTFSWDNSQGLRFERKVSIDADYMFQITQRVVNNGTASVDLHPFGLISRHGTPHLAGFYILHEGPIGVINGTLQENSYDDLKKQKTIEKKATTGWFGLTDKYWLVALVPDATKEKTARFSHTGTNGSERYQVDYLEPALSVAPGASVEASNRFFAGAKEVRLLDRYASELGVERFDFAVDWGWFRFLTKPIFIAMDWLNHALGNFGLAILALTVLIKGLFFPLANKSYKAMSKMKLLQPEMEKLREKYGEDRQKMSQELMGLYKKHGANPMAGCLPIIIQIPVFFALYKVLFVTIEMRHAPFYGWIKDLSHYDPTSVFNLFGLLPWGPPELALLGGTMGAWPLIMGCTMFLQQKLNPQPPDPVQAKIFMLMPIFFTFLLATFPAGLVIYWAWNNILSVGQQWIIMKRMGTLPTNPKPARAGAKGK